MIPNEDLAEQFACMFEKKINNIVLTTKIDDTVYNGSRKITEQDKNFMSVYVSATPNFANFCFLGTSVNLFWHTCFLILAFLFWCSDPDPKFIDTFKKMKMYIRLFGWMRLDNNPDSKLLNNTY